MWFHSQAPLAAKKLLSHVTAERAQAVERIDNNPKLLLLIDMAQRSHLDLSEEYSLAKSPLRPTTA